MNNIISALKNLFKKPYEEIINVYEGGDEYKSGDVAFLTCYSQIEGKRISTKRLIINRGGWVGMNKFGENTIVTPKGEDKIELVGNLKDKEIVLD